MGLFQENFAQKRTFKAPKKTKTVKQPTTAPSEPIDQESLKQLTSIKENYFGANGSKFDFSLTHIDNSGKSTSLNGFIAQKGNKMRLKNDNKEFISTSDGLWTIDNTKKSVQIIEASNEMTSPLEVIKNFKKKFKFRIKEKSKTDIVHELIPLGNQEIFKIDLTCTSSNILKQIKVYEKNGDRSTYDIKNSQFSVLDNEFEFVAENFADYSIKDLR